MDNAKVTVLDIQYNEDDRAQRRLNIFDIPSAQINVSYVNSTSHIVAWHKHDIQTDYWTCIKGSFKVGLATPIIVNGQETYKVDWLYLSDKSPKAIKIPPGIYHGYKALEPGSILLYYLTEKYDPEDEIRVKSGHFNENWEVENK